MRLQRFSRRAGKWLLALLLLAIPLLFTGARHAREPQGLAILISLDERYLWLVYSDGVIFEAPVAIGIQESFVFNGKKYNFQTPRGKRTILRKEPNPKWTVPAWHYYERAAQQKLVSVHMQRGVKYDLGDSTYLEVRGDQVGRVNQFGNFWPFTPGIEIIYYGKIYIPPMGTLQRQVPDALGPYKLDMGNGYLIHGTHEYNENSIGLPASHGCVRMRNKDLARLYEIVPIGTPVYIQ